MGRRGLFRRRKAHVDERLASHYMSAMHAVSRLGDQLVEAQARNASVAERREIHARLEHELGRAVTSASAIYQQLFDAVGGRHHAHPDLTLWRRRLGDVLTVRAHHELRLIDDGGVIPPSQQRVPTRAAYGPHQAGMDFADPPDVVSVTPEVRAQGVDISDVDTVVAR
jgi:hypothetical protein